MRPVNQTRGGVVDDSLRACIASLYELPLSKVPDWQQRENKLGAEWFRPFMLWMRSHQNTAVLRLLASQALYISGSPCYLLQSEGHFSVACDGEVLHDPDPEKRCRYDRDPVYIYFVQAFIPATAYQHASIT